MLRWTFGFNCDALFSWYFAVVRFLVLFFTPGLWVYLGRLCLFCFVVINGIACCERYCLPLVWMVFVLCVGLHVFTLVDLFIDVDVLGLLFVFG